MQKKLMEKAHNIHLIGVGGCGMSALAKILYYLGYKVSGSDAKESSNTIRLKDLGVKVFIDHDKSFIRAADLVVVSSAIPRSNPEYEEALSRGIIVWQRADMLAWIMDRFQKRIAVAGTHGKTTTTSMLAKIFDGAGFDPTFLIGGEADMVDGNAKLGKGAFIIAEADESDSSFLKLSPDISVVTSIECDHMEHFGSAEKVISTFEEFLSKTRPGGHTIINIDGKNTRDMVEKLKNKFSFVKYGIAPDADFSAKDVTFNKRGSSFTVNYNGQPLGRMDLSVPGWQNVQNSLAALAVAMQCGINFTTVAAILRGFVGARRRFQLIGEQSDILIFDDYAHHPTEILVTLQAARLGWPKRRIVCVFQPHRFTRTLILKQDFARSFSNADVLILTDIYSAGEIPIPGVNGNTLVEAVKEHNKEVVYIEKKEQIPAYLIENLQPGDLLLTAGAGDIHTVAKETYSRLRMTANEAKNKQSL